MDGHGIMGVLPLLDDAPRPDVSVVGDTVTLLYETLAHYGARTSIDTTALGLLPGVVIRESSAETTAQACRVVYRLGRTETQNGEQNGYGDRTRTAPRQRRRGAG
jgi:hypothetical protein